MTINDQPATIKIFLFVAIVALSPEETSFKISGLENNTSIFESSSQQ
jgi:hypothetical protein